MIDRLQTGEHTALRYALEVVLTDVEHRRAQIKLVEELRDEDVHFEDVRYVLPLHVA